MGIREEHLEIDSAVKDVRIFAGFTLYSIIDSLASYISDSSYNYSCRIRDRSDQQLDLNDLEREYASDAELFKELLVTEPEFAEAYVSIMLSSVTVLDLRNMSFYNCQITGLLFLIFCVSLIAYSSISRFIIVDASNCRL